MYLSVCPSARLRFVVPTSLSFCKKVTRKVTCCRFGAYYAWNGETSTFDFYKGEELRRQDEKIVVEYPKTVYLAEDTHPEVFSANGSHGNWAAPGNY